MSSKPVVHFRGDSDKFTFEFMVGDSLDMGIISIKANLYDQELIEINRHIKN